MMFSKIVVATILPSAVVAGFVQPEPQNACLLASPGWMQHTCSYASAWCDSARWGPDARRCCPEACNVPRVVEVPVPVPIYPSSTAKPNSDSCRVLNYEVVKCDEVVVHKTEIVKTVDIAQRCETVTEYKEYSFSVAVERDICTSTNIPHEFITKIPTQKQECKTKSDGSSSCEIKTMIKEVPTTDYTCDWECRVGTKMEVQKVTLPSYKETCYPIEIFVEHPVNYTVKEKKCRVIQKSKQICTTTDVHRLFEASMSSYSMDESSELFSVVEVE